MPERITIEDGSFAAAFTAHASPEELVELVPAGDMYAIFSVNGVPIQGVRVLEADLTGGKHAGLGIDVIPQERPLFGTGGNPGIMPNTDGLSNFKVGHFVRDEFHPTASQWVRYDLSNIGGSPEYGHNDGTVGDNLFTVYGGTGQTLPNGVGSPGTFPSRTYGHAQITTAQEVVDASVMYIETTVARISSYAAFSEDDGTVTGNTNVKFSLALGATGETENISGSLYPIAGVTLGLERTFNVGPSNLITPYLHWVVTGGFQQGAPQFPIPGMVLPGEVITLRVGDVLRLSTYTHSQQNFGNIIGKIKAHNADGSIVGYVPVYNS